MENIISWFFQLFSPLLSLLANLLPNVNPADLQFKEAIDLLMFYGYQLSFVIPWGVIFGSVAFILAFDLIVWGLGFAIGVMFKAIDMVAQLIPF